MNFNRISQATALTVRKIDSTAKADRGRHFYNLERTGYHGGTSVDGRGIQIPDFKCIWEVEPTGFSDDGFRVKSEGGNSLF